MVDFELKHIQQRGLVMSLTPAGADETVWVREDAFGFLEPTISQHCAQYVKFSHWGVTRIERAEFLVILAEWKQMSFELRNANTHAEYTRLFWSYSDARWEFQHNFAEAKPALLRLVAQLDEWVRRVLETHDAILLHGI